MKSRSQEFLTRNKRRDTWDSACTIVPPPQESVRNSNDFAFDSRRDSTSAIPSKENTSASSSRLKYSAIPSHYLTGIGSVKDTVFSYFSSKFPDHSAEETLPKSSLKQEYCLFCTPFGPISGMITTSLSSITFQPDPRCQEVKDLGIGQFQVFVDISDVIECGAAMIPGGPFLTEYLGFPHERITTSSLENSPTPGFFQILTNAKCQVPTASQRELCAQDNLTLYLMDLNALMYLKHPRYFSSSNLCVPARDDKAKKKTFMSLELPIKKDSTTSVVHSENEAAITDSQALFHSDHQHTLLLFRFTDHERAKDQTHFLIDAIDKHKLRCEAETSSTETISNKNDFSKSALSFVPLSSNLILDILLLPPECQEEEVLHRAKKHATRNVISSASKDSLASSKSDYHAGTMKLEVTFTEGGVSDRGLSGYKHQVTDQGYIQQSQTKRAEEDEQHSLLFGSQKYFTTDLSGGEPILTPKSPFSDSSKSLAESVSSKHTMPILSRSLIWTPIIKPIENKHHRNVPCLLTYQVAAELCTAIPPILASRAFVLRFCTQRDGLSYSTFFRRLQDAGPAVILITDMHGECSRVIALLWNR